jgi:hypothetical protein
MKYLIFALSIAVLILCGCISQDGNSPKSAGYISSDDVTLPTKASLYLVRNPPAVAVSLLDQNYDEVAYDNNLSLTVMRGRFDRDSVVPGMHKELRIASEDFSEKVVGSSGESRERLVAIIPLDFQPETGDILKITAISEIKTPEQRYTIPARDEFGW